MFACLMFFVSIASFCLNLLDPAQALAIALALTLRIKLLSCGLSKAWLVYLLVGWLNSNRLIYLVWLMDEKLAVGLLNWGTRYLALAFRVELDHLLL